MSLQDNNKKGCLAHPIWTVIGTIATILTFAFAIFVWLFPDVHTLIPDSSTTPITRSSSPIVTSTPDSGSPLNPGSNHRIASNKRLAIFFSNLQNIWTFSLFIGFISSFIISFINVQQAKRPFMLTVHPYIHVHIVIIYFFIFYLSSLIVFFTIIFALGLYFTFWTILLSDIVTNIVYFVITYFILKKSRLFNNYYYLVSDYPDGYPPPGSQ